MLPGMAIADMPGRASFQAIVIFACLGKAGLIHQNSKRQVA
jgi:hypothetical protein